ncbi:MAE_28990/MAE_18760 family HEPN-like nuclease [Sediminibacterium salmoneum]|uniref:MAE_28990/MAE_18760 family HEPN-like nuclease n=1 Tax=Sediminibacterium salmoneum TaxID=426421 RepID=UPI0004B27EFC|nr:MAE_28990/MAE_18760 family HEPN-like nuclease [Sediminibacterium salmoneum]
MQIKEFEDKVINDWTWRKREVSDLILLAEREENAVLLKSIILLLYAHWEGYIKKCAKTYLKYICDHKHRLSDLTENFKAAALKGVSGEIIKSSNNLTLQNEIAFIQKFSKIENHTIDVHLKIDLDNEKDKNIINTQDNLNPKVFKNILKIIGLEYKKQYESKEVFINTYLLSNRNSIGHGSKELFNDDNFELEIESLKKLRDVTIVIIENFRDEIIEFAREKIFLKVNNKKSEAVIQQFENRLKEEFDRIDNNYKQ